MAMIIKKAFTLSAEGLFCSARHRSESPKSGAGYLSRNLTAEDGRLT